MSLQRIEEHLVERTTLYASGAPKRRVQYKVRPGGALVREGMSWFWSESGQLLELTEYRNGVQVGPVIMWYANGRIGYIALFKDGKPHGPAIAFDWDGAVKGVVDED